MEIVYLLFIFFYGLALWSMERLWRRERTSISNKEYGASKVILIPFRNETKHLPRLLINLADVIPSSQEVVFIDDGSTDDSYAIISGFIRKQNLSRWVLLKSAGIGKKAALTTGVDYTQAEIILTTDADCILPPDWVRSMSRPFEQPETQLVAGPVMAVGRNGFFARFQQIEWGSILLLTNCLFSVGRPLMCSGANLAYRKSAFIAVQGYSGNEMHPSGDDEFLLKKIVRHYGVRALAYLKEKEVLVETQPAASWSSFVQQRVRWASKWRLHRSAGHALSAGLAFLLAIFEFASIPLLFGSMTMKLIFLLFWSAKILIEKRVLSKVLADFHLSQPLPYYIGTSFLHPIYVILVGIRVVSGNYSWKGRNHKTSFNFASKDVLETEGTSAVRP
jgi:biofilm PGA synthesis N-glycosyltransferase PgaC